MTIQLDIWGNITDYIFDDKWYRQTFIENKLVRYKDYQGNYWDTNLGYFFLPILKLKFVTSKCHGYPNIIFEKELVFGNELYYVTEPIFINGELHVNFGKKTPGDEITALLSQNIAEEIDREILNDLLMAGWMPKSVGEEVKSLSNDNQPPEIEIQDLKLKNYEYNRYLVGGAEI